MKWRGRWQLGMPLGILRPSCCQRTWGGGSQRAGSVFFKYNPREKKASVVFVTEFIIIIIIIIISPLSPRMFLVRPRAGRRDGFGNEIQSSSTFVRYFIISLLHLSVLCAGSFIFHMTGFLIIVGPLRWPMSDLKAIKHKTFCKTRKPLWSRRPCNASPGNYDNNSVAVGVSRSPWGVGCDGKRFTKVQGAGAGQGGVLGLTTHPLLS